MKHDKKAVLFLVVLIVVTIGAVVLVGVQGWKYLNDGVFEDLREEYEDYLAQKEEDDRKKDKDDAEDAIVYVTEPADISDIDIEEILKGIEGIEQVIGENAYDDLISSENGRTNTESPEERVYDYGDILTDDEEEKLRNYIAICEEEYSMDIVLLILNEDMEASGMEWEVSMMTRAESFYDDNRFGYNEVYGDGVLLLDNWYGEQAGSWITTAGDVWFSDDELDAIYDDMYAIINEDPCEAYRVFVEKACEYK